MVLLRPQKTDHKSNMLEKDEGSWTDNVRKEDVLQSQGKGKSHYRSNETPT